MPTIATGPHPRKLARILVAPAFNLGAGPWEILPMRASTNPGGYELLGFDRPFLPEIGQATFTCLYGIIDGRAVGAELGDVSRALRGAAWDPDTDTAGARNLAGYEVRIQLAPWVAPGSTPAWRTEWWGQVSLQEDRDWPGAPYPAGMRTYHCVDGFARARGWFLHRHSVYSSSRIYPGVAGALGYNIGADGSTVGNRSTVAVTSATDAQLLAAGIPADTDGRYYCHAPQGVDATWTDSQAIENACRIARAVGDPLFTLYGNGAGDSTDPLRLLSEPVGAWPVSESDTAWDLTARIAKRERGRGLVGPDWADDSADPTGTLSVRLRVFPQTDDTIAWIHPVTLAQSTLPGATSAGTTKQTVDLVGDHRLVAEDFRVATAHAQRVDAVETVGERIQVLVTVSAYDSTPSWAKTWDAAYEATVAALDAEVRAAERYHGFWTLGQLPLDWRGEVADHNGGTVVYQDFRCNDDGALAVSSADEYYTSPLAVRLLPDLPLLAGYDYSSGTPARIDGADEDVTPPRRPPFVVVRVGSGAYLAGDDLDPPMALRVGDHQAQVYAPADLAAGTRVIAGTSTASTEWSATYPWNALGLTLGLELPHRLRLRSIRSGLATSLVRVTQRIEIPNLHLWLAHSGAIWDLDRGTVVGDGYSPKRAAGGGSGVLPGILRDDRGTLARIHALACAWYLVPRQTATWSLRDCGLVDSFESVTDTETGDTTTVTYPRWGQVVQQLRAAGQTRYLGTPVTKVSYDHTRQITTWETSWPSLDFR